MRRETRWDIRWLRRYKLISCIGVAAVIIPFFELTCFGCAGDHTPLVALIAVPLLLCFGYGIQSLLALHRCEDPSIVFTFESRPVRIRPGARFLACLIVIPVSAAAGAVVGNWLIEFRDLPVRGYFGPAFFALSCAAVSVIGCLLVPYVFNQLLTLRNMPEIFGFFMLIFGIETFWGEKIFGPDNIWSQGVDFLFVSCFWVYFLCLALTINQEYVIKPSYFSSTCYATGELRRAGLISALRLWLGSILMQIPLLMMLSLLVMPFRLLFMTERYIWHFPFEGYPMINMGLFGISLASAVVGAVLLFLRLQHEDMRGWGRTITEWFRTLRHRLLSVFQKRLHAKKKKTSAQKEPEIRHYVDTLTHIVPRRPPRTWNARSFRRQLLSLPTPEEKYCFAYRVLVQKLLTKEIGLHATQTPREMARIVTAKTTLSQMTEITEIFLRSAYAKENWASEEDVEMISKITLNLLES